MNTGYAILDGVSVKLAQIHNSKFAYILFYQNAANVIGRFLSGLAIQDSDEFGHTGFFKHYPKKGYKSIFLQNKTF